MPDTQTDSEDRSEQWREDHAHQGTVREETDAPYEPKFKPQQQVDSEA